MTALLEARNVTKVFGGGIFNKSRTIALEDFSLTIQGEPPSVTAMVGESGSGKTTLGRLLLGLVDPTHGEILYKGKELRMLSSDERHQFRRDVQVIFQDPFEVYNPFYKVDHVLMTPVLKFRLASSKSEARKLVEEALLWVGLRPNETLGRYPHQLSGGQRQRVMVARAMLLRPKLIIADEPVSMVDASLRATILEGLGRLKQEFGVSLLYITHDLTTAYQISENIIVLYQGSVAEAGEIDLVIKQPKHPYTAMLISSIPQPDPEQRWGGDTPQESTAASVDGQNCGCKFADRCPYAMPICVESPPPFYQTDDRRAVACYLHKEATPVAGRGMDGVFAGRFAPHHD
jgi:oligopeptide/dipeptide ABC transporter ATP-binding protein